MEDSSQECGVTWASGNAKGACGVTACRTAVGIVE